MPPQRLAIAEDNPPKSLLLGKLTVNSKYESEWLTRGNQW